MSEKIKESEMSAVTVPENKLAELQIKASQRDELLDVIGKMIGDLHERAYHELMTDPKHYAASALKQLIAKAKGE